MRILMATDAFPPTCGGSGWSTYELARGLRARGHHIVVVHAGSGPAPARTYEGFDVRRFRASGPPVPFVRNYCKNERFYPRLAAYLRELIDREQIEIVHAQHVLTGPAVASAARGAGIRSVCTLRDYWPICYWGDLIRTMASDELCPRCSAGSMVRCLRTHARLVWPLGVPAIPYMRANLRLKRRRLAEVDAVVAVSTALARDLRARVPELAAVRLETIPNAVNVAAMRGAAQRYPRPVDHPYALFVGKLARNKGVSHLAEVVERAGLDIPLVVVGDGPERDALADTVARTNLKIRILGWQDREDVFRWLCHATLLVFPSRGPETLSRVLLEASALGVPIAAMDTGGTTDILTHEDTALLSTSAEGLARDVARLAADAALRQRLGAAAAAMVASRFDVPVVVGRMEQLYAELIQRPEPADDDDRTGVTGG